ncbi:hypothetical protein Pcinc_043424 [Petrolisthes cinctipes]|uniref:Uncharacterized protein n=1 Tax=Petrolisthes cinctipes TaxID=88211 RepID=A0AAE1EF24_PETCI|nr:hypothetical protein Pcinc_043424 [Petrolisthes cinctipes]
MLKLHGGREGGAFGDGGEGNRRVKEREKNDEEKLGEALGKAEEEGGEAADNQKEKEEREVKKVEYELEENLLGRF